jgi:hypothetical protein
MQGGDMTEADPQWPNGREPQRPQGLLARSQRQKSPSAHSAPEIDLNYHNTYICPICRHGHISALSLMDAFACDFCRHIFTANLAEQTIRVEDSAQPMAWRWHKRRWQSVNQGNVDLTVTVWLLSVILAFLPPVLVWLPSYVFPAAVDSQGNWVPTLWLGLTGSVHLLLALWLLMEHYQVPGYVMLKLKLQEISRRRGDRA